MLKTVSFLLVSLLFSHSALAESQLLSFAGIWQDVKDSTRYYSIQERDDAVVLIDLRRLEQTRDTLSSAYIGKGPDLFLTRIGPRVPEVPDFNGQVYLHFTSSTEGVIMGVCEVCMVVPINIRKVF